MGSYTIGVLARSANVSVETVRYYERRGLLQQPDGTGGYRQYSDDDLRRLEFVRRAKQLGFTLSEIRELVGASQSRSAEDVLAAVRAKLVQVDDDVRNLERLRRRLSRLVEVCEDGGSDCVALRTSE